MLTDDLTIIRLILNDSEFNDLLNGDGARWGNNGTYEIIDRIINDYGFEFSGHTEFLADISNTKNVVMLLANSKLKVALLTTHLPLSKVSELSLIHI